MIEYENAQEAAAKLAGEIEAIWADDDKAAECGHADQIATLLDSAIPKGIDPLMRLKILVELALCWQVEDVLDEDAVDAKVTTATFVRQAHKLDEQLSKTK